MNIFTATPNYSACVALLLVGLGAKQAAVADPSPTSPSGLSGSDVLYQDGFELLEWQILHTSTMTIHVVPCGNSMCSPRIGVQGDIVQPGDYDGDGKTDPATWRPQDAKWRVLLSSANLTETTPFGSVGDVPIVADYDGDGSDDRAVWNPIDGSWQVLQSSTGSFQFFPCTSGFCGAWLDKPVRGDFDGDGKDDPAIWRAFSANWIIQLSATSTVVTQPWGAVGDLPIAADYDGDGITDLAVWRPSNTSWIIRSSASGQQYFPPCSVAPWCSHFGIAGEEPQIGDFDGDGKAEAAVWRRLTDGYWRWVNTSNGTAFTLTTWGTTADQSVVGDYNGDGKADVAVVHW